MKNIVETAIDDSSFTVLVTAVKAAAGLVDALSGPGPFTLFAPNDDAFAELPAGTVDELLKDKDRLTAVLAYHVVPGKYMAIDLMKMTTAKTVQGATLTIATETAVIEEDTVVVEDNVVVEDDEITAFEELTVDDAIVLQADIECTNGVIHVIDSVLAPE
ncbi:MAG: fasciclin domain-containing protein [Halobacteriota archaeon]